MEDNNQSQIKDLLEAYCSEYLDIDVKSYVVRLFETIAQNPLMDIYRGSTQIWAASIVYVIARLNFLFDKESEDYISFDELCNYFDVKKSTIGNKATQIEKIYDIFFADRRYTKPEITKSFEFHMTPEGFIMPSFLIEKATEKEIEEMKRFDEEQRLVKQQQLEKKKAARAEEKRKELDAGQFKLFD